ncbi:MAG: mechanosensitive ion channel protein [Gammaproteobacteria bacterium SG8_47]|nr:MAG: mechanosensitive ion channel protein [Gammaproteobacteria bacterium SG8_47]
MDTQTLIDFLQPVLALLGDSPWVHAAAVFAISLLAASLLALAFARLVGALVQRTGTSVDDAIMGLLRGPLFWSVVLVGALAAITVLKLPASAVQIGRAVVVSVLIILWSTFLIRFSRVLLTTLSARARPQALVRPQTLPLFNNLVLIVVLALAIYFVFQTWHIDMTAWIASAGIAGIAIGFAAKDTLANLFSGVFILADAPYKIGDYIVLESGERGKVTHIGIRSTRLLTRDDVEVTIPNSIMGNTRVVNESGGPHEKFRVRIKVGVAYGSDIDQVRRVLMEVASNNDQVCRDPEPRVRFRSFGASGLDFELLCWAANPELRGRMLDALNTAVYKRFADEGIEIPYSKHDLYIKESPAQVRP